MAGVAAPSAQCSRENVLEAPKLTSVKQLAESADLESFPSSYIYSTNPSEAADSDSEDSIPVVDFSLLTSRHPDQRSRAVQDLGKACQEWGFFTLVNHGVPESLMKAMVDSCTEFFGLAEEEKAEYRAKHVLDPIRYGTSFNQSAEKVFFWRDFLKLFVHPEFHSPSKPAGFREILREYCERTREVARELLQGLSESLGLEPRYMEKVLDLKSGLQLFVGNLYPPCPQPELAIGLPPHSDFGLLTLLIQNDISGLQLLHNGRWVGANALPNSFMVNTGDQLEILSNGKYKSVTHRAVVNGNATRNSIVLVFGPSLDTIVGPAKELLSGESDSGAYIPTRFKEYMELQQSSKLDGKTCLGRLKVPRA